MGTATLSNHHSPSRGGTTYLQDIQLSGLKISSISDDNIRVIHAQQVRPSESGIALGELMSFRAAVLLVLMSATCWSEEDLSGIRQRG